MTNHIIRIRIVSVGVILFALLLVSKLYFVQIVSGEAFQERADRQYTRPVGGLFDRGTVFFQYKDGTTMAAASLKQGATIAINPRLLKNPTDAYEKISQLLEIDKDGFLSKAEKINDTYEEVAKRVDPTIAEKIEALDITGVNIMAILPW
jgi:cell division protein FtsI/penicillin-binding protein 2